MRLKHNKTFWGKVLPLLIILVVGGVVLSGCYGRSQPKGWSGTTATDNGIFVGSLDGRVVALNASSGSNLWFAEDAGRLGTADTKVAIYGTPAVDGDLVYAAGYNGKIYAFSIDKGSLRWVYPREGNIQAIVGGVVVSQGMIYFCTAEGEIYVLDAATGDKLWSSEVGDRVWSTLTMDGDTIYLGAFDSKLYAFSTADGSKKWEFEAGGIIVTSPLVSEDTVFFGAFDRYFYALGTGNGALKWQSEIEAGKWFWASPVIHDNVVYAPNLDGMVYMFDAGSGREVAGAAALGSPVSSAPVVVGDKIVLATEDGKVYALDTATKQAAHLVTLGENGEQVLSPLSADDGVVYVHTQSSSVDTLHAVGVETRTILWSQTLTTEK